MNSAVNLTSTFDLLNACVQHLGTAILAIWGVDPEGVCRCPQGKKCRSPGKHPNAKLCPNGVKNASRDPSIIRQWVRQAPHGNWALRCGEPIPGGGFLGAFDWDPRNGSDESLAQIQARGDELPETVTQASGGGGGHRLYRWTKSPASRSVGPGLDLQGGGKYIVIAPSRHRSGGYYTWELGLAPGDVPVADAPAWLEEGTDEAQPRPDRDGAGTARETVLGEAFFLAGRAGPVMPGGEMFVNCIQSHLHGDARGSGSDASTVILPPAGGSKFGGFKCQHGHCANLKWQEVMAFFTPEIRDAANKKYPRLAVVPDPPASQGSPAPPAPGPRASGPLDADDPISKALKQRLHFKPVKGGSYKIVSDIVNVSIVLTYDPRWAGVLKFDEFAQVIRFTRQPPFHPDDSVKGEASTWTDEDTTRLDLWLRRTLQIECDSKTIREAVYVVARRDGINPLRDYLDSLAWDGSERLERWLTIYAGCEDNDYTRIAGRKWILSAVARAYEPGCKVDTLLVLEGPQGKGKSTMLRSLVPVVSWFSDTPLAIGEKDSYVGLRGKWIVELAELASLKRADLDRTKAFFSSPVDSYRPPYGREQVSVPRTAIFAGTVNLGEYLNDATGGRRFIPVKCGVIDIETLTVDRDQLWAEAVRRYKEWAARGRPQSECLWWPSPEENPLFENEQIVRQVAGAGNPWTEAIALWVQCERARKIVEERGYLLLRDVAAGALHLSDKDLDPSAMTAMGIVMVRELGWTKKRVHVAGARAWGYYPGKGTPT